MSVAASERICIACTILLLMFLINAPFGTIHEMQGLLMGSLWSKHSLVTCLMTKMQWYNVRTYHFCQKSTKEQ